MVSIRVEYGNDVYISFPYNELLIGKIKALPIRTWLPSVKEWRIPHAHLDTFVNTLGGLPYSITRVERKKDIERAKGFKFKTEPFKHQFECFEYANTKERFFLGDEQGLGKTKSAIDIALYKRLLYGFKHCLIICGVKTLTHNWEKEIKIHSDECGYVLGESTKIVGGISKKISGGSDKKYEDLKKIDKLPYFIITNVETIRTKKITNKIVELIKRGDIDMVVFDEFHKCKNPNSMQGKALLTLKPFTRIAMTGTPLMNNPLDLYSLLYWLDAIDNNFFQFKHHYCVIDDKKQIVGFRNMEELTTVLNTVMLRRRKKDVLNLPPKIHTTEYLEMCDKQSNIYNEVRSAIIKNIDKIIINFDPLTQLIRLRQATGFTGILSSDVRLSVKYDRALDIVEEVVSNGGKVVIFSQWLQVINPLTRVLRDEGYNPAIISGEVSNVDKERAEAKFQEDSSCKVLLGTTASMGTGLTLTSANTVIFLDSPWNRATKEQAEDRCHRIGTTGTVNILTLVCKDTIDERIEDVVYNKGLLSDAIVDGKINTSKIGVLVNYLLS